MLAARNGLNDYMGWLAANFDPAISWADLDWLRQAWDGPLIIKGILNAQDARSAVRLGANGIVVSNHGGRQLDGALSSARALPAIADAVGNDLTVLADSGVRSGLDVIRLLALGARGVLLGRAWAFALAAGGERRVSQMLELFARNSHRHGAHRRVRHRRDRPIHPGIRTWSSIASPALITRRLPEAVHERLRNSYDVTPNADDLPSRSGALARALREFDALVPTITDRFDADLLQAAPFRTRVIANFGAGIEHVDLEAARRASIVVTNTPGALTDATAEMALLLMLMAARRAGEGERFLRAGEWRGWAPTQLLGQDLRGKTLGLVGFGRIARETARRARALLDVRVAYHSRTRACPMREGSRRHLSRFPFGAARRLRRRIPALPGRRRDPPPDECEVVRSTCGPPPS